MSITKPRKNQSFFSIAAWYALVAALVAAAISGLGWLSFLSDSDFAFHAMNFCFNAAMFISITSVVAGIVSLFGIRRHGWRVILWKSLVGIVLSCLVSAAPGVVFLMVLHTFSRAVHTQKQEAIKADTQTLTIAADAAAQSLLAAGVLDRAPHHPAMLEIGDIVNNTTRQFNLTLLSNQISAALVKAGKVVVIEKQQKAADIASRSEAASHPDFYLSGKVMESGERTGTLNQPTYLLAFSLVDSNGVVFWEEEKTMQQAPLAPLR